MDLGVVDLVQRGRKQRLDETNSHYPTQSQPELTDFLYSALVYFPGPARLAHDFCASIHRCSSCRLVTGVNVRFIGPKQGSDMGGNKEGVRRD